MPIVNPDDFVFLPVEHPNNVELKAEGVCICFALYGRKPDGSRFIGMHPWSGFNATEVMAEDQKSENVWGLVCKLITNARIQLGLRPNQAPSLDSIYIFGGERRQQADDGQLLLAGTEFEVSALQRYLKTHCEDQFVCSEETGFHFRSFLATGDDILTVTMQGLSEPSSEVSRYENDSEIDMEPESLEVPNLAGPTSP